MALALGALGWTPESFWRSTFAELWAAALGRARAHRPRTPARLSRRERESLHEILDAAPERVASIRRAA